MRTARLDLFPGPIEPELASAHEHMDAFFADAQGLEAFRLKPQQLKALRSFETICALPGPEMVLVIRAAAERAHWSVRESNRPGSRAYNTSLKYLAEDTPQHFEGLLEVFLRILCAKKLPTTDDDLVHLLSIIRRAVKKPQSPQDDAGLNWWIGGSLARLLKSHKKTAGVSPKLGEEVQAVVRFLRSPDTSGAAREARMRKLANELEYLAAT
ncbi:MAG TPA: hypothetical protein PLX89_04750 [Verrucomicrobiota bacterium]|nr:hypothetical protein [Verrucomicrobiales bacterium]HRI12295.1 hypothetical protein [Verrucomicrobiota bacterium]